MNMTYEDVYAKLDEYCKDQKYDVNFTKDINKSSYLEDVFKYMVYHCQNNSKAAFNFFKYDKGSDNEKELSKEIFKIIKEFKYSINDSFNYLLLFNELKPSLEKMDLGKDKFVSGKDIQLLGLCKSCLSIKKFLSKFNYFGEFKYNEKYQFSNNYKMNIKKIEAFEKEIYGMGFTLSLDYFKEQDFIEGREYLIKTDTHMMNLATVLFDGESLTEETVYNRICELYDKSSDGYKKQHTLYMFDKIVYTIGKNNKDSKDLFNKIFK